MHHIEEQFSGTPYLISTDASSVARFSKVLERANRSREKSISVQARIAAEGRELFEPYQRAVRSRLVSESNKIEGYEWSYVEVNEVALTYRELLNGSIATIMEAVRQDRRVYQALGLYKAHEVADEWARSSYRPREFEIRALHELIVSGHPYAGRYKQKNNEIEGASLRTADPWDVPLKMRELSDWWQGSTVDPALEATMVHAWLTHIHPFDDGNGRIARILANVALARNGFPPLLVQSQVDRGQYYDALAASDEGDILPLYDLFVSILNRTVRLMSKPNYVGDIIRDRLLTSSRDRYGLWKPYLDRLLRELSRELRSRGWSLQLQGVPDLNSFALLEERDSGGNSWFVKILDGERSPRWLLWYGFSSDRMVDLMGGPTLFPSIFTSRRVSDPSSVHPYAPYEPGGEFPDEIVLRPMERKPILYRSGFDLDELDISIAVSYFVDSLVS